MYPYLRVLYREGPGRLGLSRALPDSADFSLYEDSHPATRANNQQFDRSNYSRAFFPPHLARV